jgi:hypothetical protein
MNLLAKLSLEENEIPAGDLVIVGLLRKFLGDDATLNRLERVQENTDLELYHALLMALDQINVDFSPITTYSEFSDIPSWAMLAYGATLNVLTSKGILSARNTLTYTDSGGVTVQDYDKYGRYINYFNVLVNKFMMSVKNWKENKNIDDAYGTGGEGQSSEYSWEY